MINDQNKENNSMNDRNRILKNKNKKRKIINRNFLSNRTNLISNSNSSFNTIDTTITNTLSFVNILPEDINVDQCSDNVQNQIISGDTFTFATYNVKRLKDSLNTKQIIEYFTIQNIDIIGLTETYHTIY